jgi:hypothetical protein
MQRLLPGFLILTLLAGCGTSPVASETTREVVLQYLGQAVGTAGPFGKGGKKELDVLSPADRQKAEAMIDGGAVVFLVYGGHNAQGEPQTGTTRVILVQNNKVIGDFAALPQPQPAAAPSTGT